jgi:hypothetical protein
MPLNSTGPISLAGPTVGESIAIELKRTATTQTALDETEVRRLAKVPSGAITMPTDFWNASDSFTVIVSRDRTTLNLRDEAIRVGWDQITKVIGVINAGVIIGSTSTGSPAMTVSGSFPNGVALINNGTIIGMGGAGGNGGGVVARAKNNPDLNPPAAAGGSGGTALQVSVPIEITNNGTIAGGGGGGGGGGAGGTGGSSPSGSGGGGGGGGRSGIFNSSGGAGGSGTNSSGTVGSPGAFYGEGGGGAGGGHATTRGGVGGNGGGWGAGGIGGARGAAGASTSAGGAGGAAGSCTVGGGNITWLVTGTRLGPLN